MFCPWWAKVIEKNRILPSYTAGKTSHRKIVTRHFPALFKGDSNERCNRAEAPPSHASRSASFSAIAAIPLATELSTGSALRRKEKARQLIAGGMVGRSTTPTLFSPGPRRESATSRRASPAMARAHLDGSQPRKPQARPHERKASAGKGAGQRCFCVPFHNCWNRNETE
jgi:hypothetical protein